MSQWGEVRVKKGLRLIPVVETEAFARIRRDHSSIIGDLILLDTKHSKEKTEKRLKKLKDKYVGEEYKNWVGE